MNKKNENGVNEEGKNNDRKKEKGMKWRKQMRRMYEEYTGEGKGKNNVTNEWRRRKWMKEGRGVKRTNGKKRMLRW